MKPGEKLVGKISYSHKANVSTKVSIGYCRNCSKLDVQGLGGGRILGVDRRGGGSSKLDSKLDNFH